MNTQARELYCYVTGTNPFMECYEKLNSNMVSVAIATRGLVKDAIGQYQRDYGSGTDIFDQDDFNEVVEQIIHDVKEREGKLMSDYVTNALVKFGIEKHDIFTPYEMDKFDWRKPTNGIESEGVLYTAAKWFADHYDWEDIESAYDNIHGWRDNVRGGSFNIDENYLLYDDAKMLEIDDVILSGSCVFLEVRDMNEDEAVAYIRLN